MSTNSTTADPTLRRCTHCHAQYPFTHYGLFRMDKSGYTKICKECSSEIKAKQWTRKWGRRKALPQSIVRGVKWNNEAILDHVLTTTKMELRGFDFITKAEYKIFYGPSERLGLNAMTLFTRSGSVFIEWALLGVPGSKEMILAYLRAHSIRLEYTDSDVIASKTTIYYL
jgi:hypothetical protein